MMVALMVAGVSISLGVTAMVASSIAHRDSGVDRQRTVSIAAAEAGIDATVDAIRRAAKADFENSLPCKWPAPTPANPDPKADAGTHPDVTTVSAKVTYYQGTIPLACPITTPGVRPTRAEVTSTAETNALGNGSTRGRRAMTAVVALTPPFPPPTSKMTHAFFSHSSVNLTNQLKIIGGGTILYSNGDFTCNSDSDINGAIHAQGNVSIQNKCKTGAVWAGLNASAGSGDVPEIRGDLTAGSPTGDIDFFNNPVIVRGRTTAGRAVKNRTRATLEGGYVEGTPVGPPPRTGLLAVPDTTVWNEANKPAYQPKDWRDLYKENARANSGDENGNLCDVRGQVYSIGHAGLVTPASPTIIDTRTYCPTSIAFNGVKITLRSDVVMYAKAFTGAASNGKFFEVTTDPPTAQFKLRIVIPSPTTNPPTETATCGPSIDNTNITFLGDAVRMGNARADGTSNVITLLYTQQKISLHNTFSMTGTVHACKVYQNSSTAITYADVGPPQTGLTTGDPYTVNVRSKYETKS